MFRKAILSLASVTFGFATIVSADAPTNTTARFLDLSLAPRLVELGTDRNTGQRIERWFNTQRDGVKLHCTRHLLALAWVGGGEECARAADKYALTKA